MADFPLFELEVQITRLDHELLAGFNVILGDDSMHKAQPCNHGEPAQLRHNRYSARACHALDALAGGWTVEDGSAQERRLILDRIG